MKKRWDWVTENKKRFNFFDFLIILWLDWKHCPSITRTPECIWTKQTNQHHPTSCVAREDRRAVRANPLSQLNLVPIYLVHLTSWRTNHRQFHSPSISRVVSPTLILQTFGENRGISRNRQLTQDYVIWSTYHITSVRLWYCREWKDMSNKSTFHVKKIRG